MKFWFKRYSENAWSLGKWPHPDAPKYVEQDDEDYSAEGTMRYLRGVLKFLGVFS